LTDADWTLQKGSASSLGAPEPRLASLVVPPIRLPYSI
jgi:hypothetical protein